MNNNSLTIDRHLCIVCKSKDQTVLFEAKHNSPGFFDFIKLERFYSKSFYDFYSNGELNNLSYKIVECNSCHFIFLGEVLNSVGMELLYNEWLDKDLLKVYYEGHPYNKSEESMLKIIKKRFKKEGDLNVLDFGAGYGNFCAIAKGLGFNTYAFDLSTDKAHQINSLGVNIINNFDKYENYFDLIYINQVFEHVSDPGMIILDLQKCLKKNGIMIVGTPNCKEIKNIIKNRGLSLELFQLLSPHQHINAFTHKSLVQLGENNQLKPYSVMDYLKLFNFPMTKDELIYLGKRTIKNPFFGTGIYFSKSKKRRI